MLHASADAATVSAADCTGPLARTYQRLARTCASLHVDVLTEGQHPAAEEMSWTAAEAGEYGEYGLWTDGARLAADPEMLDSAVNAEAARVGVTYDHVPRGDVAASRVLHHYLWSVALLMSGPWYLERRVPRVRPRDVYLNRVTDAFAIRPGGFACLPDDPAAGLPGARVVGHEEALRGELRAAVADHMRPLLTAIGPRLRRGPRALWGMAGDDLVSGIWYLGRMLADEERSVRAATELLPEAIPPFPGGADFRRLAGRDGASYPTRTRLGCCLYYTIRPDEACVTCPRTRDAERLRRLEP
ncbi:(2Fe-2S)-binding protein [Streptomyces sp. H27-D2]|uniref:(2Fe-2S)-binding protein n=1 Tax=Streptomyces sp. H27-D2 TaxID=3046304 RepID=UPI002DBA1219|nr:(2Fe-2S)-binding protein [Streptomyces sp. H27-D2]MEC4020980.1 (2Fe-2S)-binding protein [Streptomyces sp. H27-D2]